MNMPVLETIPDDSTTDEFAAPPTSAPMRDTYVSDSPLRVKVVSACDLTPRHIEAWARIQRDNKDVDSPLFRPEFTLAVANERDDVEVAVLEQDGELVGFFPYHRCRGEVAQPIGFALSDFHGVVMQSGVKLDAVQLLRDCDLNAWHFDHLIASQDAFAAYHWREADSPFMDLSQGFEQYQTARQADGSDTIKQVLRKMRKIEREVGPLDFMPFCTDDELFQQMIEWKLEQYRRIRSVNHLAEPWKIELLKSLVHTRGESFSGMMSGLWAGKQLMAVHLGLLSGGVLHCWFPTYSDELAKYSPGLIFWIRLAQAAPSLGIRRIDLGKGPERYKRSLMTGAIELAEGSLDRRPVARTLRRTWLSAREWVRSSPLKQPAQNIVRGIRGLVCYR